MRLEQARAYIDIQNNKVFIECFLNKFHIKNYNQVI